LKRPKGEVLAENWLRPISKHLVSPLPETLQISFVTTKGNVVDSIPSQDPKLHRKLQAYGIVTPSVGSEIRRHGPGGEALMQTLTRRVTGKQASCHFETNSPNESS
jgi:hypothetical protein